MNTTDNSPTSPADAPVPEVAGEASGVPARSPFQRYDWVQLHGYPGNPLGPRRWDSAAMSPAASATILTGVTDDGGEWAECWGALQADGEPNNGWVSCTCCPRTRPAPATPQLPLFGHR